MALFFDTAWFESQLAQRSISRAVMAAAAGMSEADLTLVFKDQRELSAREVGVFAELLGVGPAEIALHAGVSTPVPGEEPEARLSALERRVSALEAELAQLRR